MAGPRPTTPLSTTRRQVLERVAGLGDDPVTLSEVHGDSSHHLNATRQILTALVESNHLESTPIRSGGRGRPPLGWRLTAKGHAALAEVDAAGTALAVVASYLINSDGGPTAHDLGVAWSRTHNDLVPDPPDGCAEHRVEGLVTVLDALGFDPVHRTTEAGDAVSLQSCPLVGAARQRPEVVCEMHRGFLDGVIHKLGVSEGLTLIPFADEHTCRVELANDATHRSS